MSQCEAELVAGEFDKHYSTLKQIAMGAYRHVKMAYRTRTGCWRGEARDPDGDLFVDHRSFENDKFYQLVMEKHACGMDLLECR